MSLIQELTPHCIFIYPLSSSLYLFLIQQSLNHLNHMTIQPKQSLNHLVQPTASVKMRWTISHLITIRNDIEAFLWPFNPTDGSGIARAKRLEDTHSNVLLMPNIYIRDGPRWDPIFFSHSIFHFCNWVYFSQSV